MATQKAPETVIRRMPRYYRYLQELEDSGKERVSSREMADHMGLTASQIRQDLNCFGGFGQQGYGYNVIRLRSQIASILGLDYKYSMIILGAGNIGQALSNYAGFEKDGFLILAAFDIKPEYIGKRLDAGVKVFDMAELERFILVHKVDIGVIATPPDVAQSIADRLIFAGIQYIWNFAPTEVYASQNAYVENVQLTDSLLMLSCRIHGYTKACE